jgi:hypothetical protein
MARLLQGIGHAELIGVMPGSTQYLFLRRKTKEGRRQGRGYGEFCRTGAGEAQTHLMQVRAGLIGLKR